MRLYSEIELNEQLDRLHLSPKQKDNVRHLIENITDRYSNQIEKMKCCGNCKHFLYVNFCNLHCEDVDGDNGCKEWELTDE